MEECAFVKYIKQQYICKPIYFLPLFLIPFFQICQTNAIKSILNEFKETAFY